jgi:hypothetical protein
MEYQHKNMEKVRHTKNGRVFLNCVSAGIHCNWQRGENDFLMFTGILSKLKDGVQYVYIRERGWVAI